MKKILSKLDGFYIPFDTGKMALFFSVLALAYVASASNTPCLSASTCAVGSNPTFEQNIGIKGGTAFSATLDASTITNDRTLTIPDNAGTLALTSDIPSVPSLTADKIMATDGTGAYSTTNVYPLSFSTNKPIVSDSAGNLTDITLSANEPVITDGNGNLSTSLIDITTDIDASSASANDEIRVGSGGALEYFTPTSGSPVTLLDSGSVSVSGDEFLICWYGTTFDPDKKYKLVLWGGDGNIGTMGYKANLKLSNNDCDNNYRAEFTAEVSTSGRWLGSGTSSNPYTASSGVWAYSQTGFRNIGQCYPLTATNYGTFYRPANIGGEFTFQSAGGFTSTTGDRGALMKFDMYADTFDYSQSYFMGVNTGEGFCTWQNTTNMFADITGMYGQLEGGNPHPVTNKKWSLYEVASQ